MWLEPGDEETYMREYLATVVHARSGVRAYKSDHVQVRVNGAYYGLMLFVESPENPYLMRVGMADATNGGSLIKVEDVVSRFPSTFP